MMEKVKVNPEIFKESREETEEILKRAGVGDLIELMKCKNCLNSYNKDNKCYCKETNLEVGYENNCPIWTEKIQDKKELKEIYEEVIKILKYYLDLEEDNFSIIAWWIIGTWLHKYFTTYPYLYFQAMKGSGKTRVLKLIKELSWEGEMLASLSEAVLFRTQGTLCIDEFEGIGSKDKNALRELLNTAYKQGGKVKRMRKKKSIVGEEQVVETFDTFRPIVMANIWGMEEVLGDRCINVVIEKSDNKAITRKVEHFESDDSLIKVKQRLKLLSSWCSLCSVVTHRNIYREWNEYISHIDITTLTTHTTLDTLNTFTTLFKKIYDTGIDGRSLELTFPLLLIAEELGMLDESIKIFTKKINDKREDDIMESRDVLLYSFISKQTPKENYKVKEITNMFRKEIDIEDMQDTWLNPKWMGRALKRLNLIIDRRRIGEGIEVTLNVDKAIEKLKIFK